jgi:K+-sensing histidine kinase KdpD
MEKSGVIKILPKEKPWELQRYALTSFKFLDVEKNSVSFATNDEIEKTGQAMNSRPKSESAPVQLPKSMNLQLPLLIAIIAVSLSLTIWTLTQSPVNLAIFIAAFFLAVTSSAILGALVAKK